ncbi:DUF58 domain-containing protein [Microbacterium album]|uniref:DUF58 domain-containing protein n=1 Tax=Microbacterium album TaxID=2053191 RepID=UPI001663D276|nr:DUF58 domain-containing protein [Microbacterium album]
MVVGTACLVAAYALARVELAVLGLTLLTLVAGAGVGLLLAGRVTDVRRSLSTEVARVGGVSHVRLSLSLSARPIPGGAWRDALPDALAALEASGASGPLSAGARDTTQASYAVVGMRRGRHAIGPLMAESSDPFGLVRLRRPAGERTPVSVVPAVVPLPPLPGAPAATGGARSAADRHGQGADNLIPRPYAPGDSMRRIHWRASARHDELMVREEERETTPRAVVVIDRSGARWGRHAAQGQDPEFESAVTMCVSAAWSLVRDGYSVDVMDSEGVLLALVGGPEDVEGMLVAFAGVEPVPGDALPGLASALGEAASAPVILVARGLSHDDVAGLGSVAARSPRSLLLAAGTDPDVLDHASRAGWHTAHLGGDVEATWAAAIGEHAAAGTRTPTGTREHHARRGTGAPWQ